MAVWVGLAMIAVLRPFLAVAVFAFGSASGADIIGHRGASADAPENTLAAINLAWRQGADAVEIDIRRTRDGRAVVIHDETTQRTTGVDLNVAGSTLAQLRELDAGGWRGPQWQGERIPTLAEALATVPAGKRLYVELKSGPAILPEIERVVRASGKAAAQVVFIGFDLATMAELKRRNPAHRVHWIVSPRRLSGGRLPGVDELVRQTRAANLDGLFLRHTFAIDAGFLRKTRAAGLRAYAWTVNDPATAKRFAAAGIDGIVTDRPGPIRAAAR